MAGRPLKRARRFAPAMMPRPIVAPSAEPIHDLVPYSKSQASSLSDPPSPETPAAKKRAPLRREWLLLTLSLLVLIAVVAPPLVNLERYQRRIVNTMSRSLGREVTMRSVSMRLLPTPALVLADVVIHEEPGFGAEPALRAPSVIAQVRLASLWRGRLEVSRVEISDASLNLVRDASGRWSVGSVLLQASHLANAPTGQRRAGPAPRFPYIEITDSRVNLKQGVEKLPYSLQNANLSMWLAEPELWQLRLDGQPIRTDIELGLADTGILRIEGRLHRATALGQMPLALHGDWSSAPLGQASRLLLGSDQGWRGDLHITADVAGDLDKLAIKTRVLIANLHREEFTPAEPFAVDASCHASYSRKSRTLDDLGCRWPVGSGQLLLTGSVTEGGPAFHQLALNPGLQSALALTVQHLPASFLIAAAGLARSDFVPAFHLEGALNGMLFYNARSGSTPLYAGVLEAPLLRLKAEGLRQPLELNDTRLAAATPAPSGVSTLVFSTAPLDLGGPEPTTVSAQLTAQGFLLHASGSASVARLEELGRGTHLLPAAMAWLAPQGMAEFDVTRNAGWQGETAETGVMLPFLAAENPLSRDRAPAASSSGTVAVTNGWLRLRNASYAPRFLPQGVLLSSAQATFSPGSIAWSVPAAVFGRSTLQLAATYPLDCAGNCVTQFRASSATLDGDTVLSSLTDEGRLLDQLLNRLDANTARWPALDGTIHADTAMLGRLALRNADMSLSIAGGKASILSLDAQTLGGTLHGEGSARMEAGVPRYELTTVLARASASAAGALFHENWGGGSLTLASRLRLGGITAAELAASAVGEFHADWAHGGLGTQTPLAHFALWTGDGHIENQALTLTRGTLTPSPMGDLLPVSGTIAFDRAVALTFGAGSDGIKPGKTGPAIDRVAVTGTLPRPRE